MTPPRGEAGDFGQHVVRLRNGIALQGDTPFLHRIPLPIPNCTVYSWEAPNAKKSVTIQPPMRNLK